MPFQPVDSLLYCTEMLLLYSMLCFTDRRAFLGKCSHLFFGRFHFTGSPDNCRLLLLIQTE